MVLNCDQALLPERDSTDPLFGSHYTCIHEAVRVVVPMRVSALMIMMVIVVIIMFVMSSHNFYSVFALMRNELATTETLESAIASPANTGFRSHPNSGKNIPAASGIPTML